MYLQDVLSLGLLLRLPACVCVCVCVQVTGSERNGHSRWRRLNSIEASPRGCVVSKVQSLGIKMLICSFIPPSFFHSLILSLPPKEEESEAGWRKRERKEPPSASYKEKWILLIVIKDWARSRASKTLVIRVCALEHKPLARQLSKLVAPSLWGVLFCCFTFSVGKSKLLLQHKSNPFLSAFLRRPGQKAKLWYSGAHLGSLFLQDCVWIATSNFIDHNCFPSFPFKLASCSFLFNLFPLLLFSPLPAKKNAGASTGWQKLKTCFLHEKGIWRVTRVLMYTKPTQRIYQV